MKTKSLCFLILVCANLASAQSATVLKSLSIGADARLSDELGEIILSATQPYYYFGVQNLPGVPPSPYLRYVPSYRLHCMLVYYTDANTPNRRLNSGVAIRVAANPFVAATKNPELMPKFENSTGEAFATLDIPLQTEGGLRLGFRCVSDYTHGLGVVRYHSNESEEWTKYVTLAMLNRWFVFTPAAPEDVELIE